MKKDFRWPKGFLWGAATAAHQVEGGNTNNWTAFELERAPQLARTAAERYQSFAIWPDIKDAAGQPDTYVSGLSTDHFRRYKEDITIMQELNFTTFRCSIEWSRCEPKEGVWDAAAFAHYKSYLNDLRAAGITPILTLYHWTHPLWFEEKGAFARAKNIAYFERFAAKVAKELGMLIPYVCTINEPDTVMMQGYVMGNHAPGKKQPLTAMWVYRNLLRAHKRVYKLWKKVRPDTMVGMTKQFAHVAPANQKVSSRIAARLDYALRDDFIMQIVRRRSDFIGVQFYFCDRYDGFRLAHQNDVPHSDLDWPMRPRMLEPILKRVERYGLPIIVTETGLADMHDQYRAGWIDDTIESVKRALAAGVDIRGYVYWSLLDNFEWAEGNWPRFGLVEIDYEHKRNRIIRPSARHYADVIRSAKATEKERA